MAFRVDGFFESKSAEGADRPVGVRPRRLSGSDELYQVHDTQNHQNEDEHGGKCTEQTESQAKKPSYKARDQTESSCHNAAEGTKNAAKSADADATAAKDNDSEHDDESYCYYLPHLYHQLWKFVINLSAFSYGFFL